MQVMAAGQVHEDGAAREPRRLAAVLAADVVGYRRLMAADEAGTLARLKAHRAELIYPLIEKNHGRVFKTAGDGLLAEFASVVDAVQCAVEVQRRMAKRNRDVPPDRRFLFRMGVNIGDVIVDGDDIHGEGVNIAARLEGLSEAGGLLISATAHEHVKAKLPLGFDDLGMKKGKPQDEPLRVFRVRLPEGEGPSVAIASARRNALALTAGALAVTALVAAAAVFALRDGPVPPVVATGVPPQVPTADGDRIAIAVLSFSNLSNDPEQEYFADGIADEILNALTRFSGLKVIARNSSFRYKGQNHDIRQIGHELGTRYVLEGSVRREGERLRVTAQLIDASDGKHVWSERYDRPRADLFSIQDEITVRIAAALGRDILRNENREIARLAATTGDEKFDAYDLTILGRELWFRAGRENILKSRDLFERAIARDPSFAPAWVNLVGAYNSILVQQLTPGVTPSALAEKMLEIAAHGLALDPRSALGHAMYGVALTANGRYEEARAEADRVAELNANDYVAQAWIALAVLTRLGDQVEAARLLERFLKDDPFPQPSTLQAYGRVLYLSGRYDDAVAAERRCIATSPQHPGCHALLSAALAQLGRQEEARRFAGDLLRILPTYRVSAEYAALRQRHRLVGDADHLAEGLRKAGLPE